MGVNSTDISHDQSESILHGIESEHAWGVLLHGTREIGISGNNGRGGVSWKYQEALERRKRVILSHWGHLIYSTCFPAFRSHHLRGRLLGKVMGSSMLLHVSDKVI
jgi:hypothetical protein